MPDPAPVSRACPACGAANAAHATFCLECGEPLDTVPTPQSAIRTPQSGLGRREVALGLALVLLVLGYATWDWRHAEDQAQAYSAGTRAAAAQDWDGAVAALAGVGDYHDARQRLADAQAQVQRRDTTYRAGQAAAARQDWLDAYRAYSETVAIQPAYRDTPQLFAQARDRAVAAALTGTVVLQSSGPAPGLYWRDPAGGASQRLPGSDATSVAWWATNPALGRFLYLAPRPGVTPVPSSLTNLDFTGRQQFWLGGLDGGSLALWPATDTNLLPFLPTAHGVWVLQYGDVPPEWSTFARTPLGSLTGADIPLAQLAYYDSDRRTMTDRLPAGSVTLLNTDPATGRLLLGLYDFTPRRSRILLLAPDTPAPQVVADVTGLVYWAGFSPDGTALAYAAGLGATGPILSVALAWRDLTTAPPPTLLTSAALAGYQPGSTLLAAWVPGARPRRLLVRRVDGDAVSLRLLDPGHDERLLWQTSLSALAMSRVPNNARVFVAPNGLGAFLLAPPPTVQEPDRLLWLPFAPDTPPVLFAPFPPDGGPLQDIAPAPDGDGLVVVLGASDINVTGGIYRFSRAHPAQAPTLLYSWSPGPTSLNWPQLLPGGVLSWIDELGLHLRPFDGQGDLPTQPGITQVQVVTQPYGAWLQP